MNEIEKGHDREEYRFVRKQREKMAGGNLRDGNAGSSLRALN